MTAALRVGTSGFVYRHWRGDFYPAALVQRQWFAHYAEQFDTVELNTTFYGLPPPATFARWRQAAPPGFCFALKYSRTATHRLRLQRPAALLGEFLANAGALGDRLGPLLVQLPPQFAADAARLQQFLAAVPASLRLALEFRHPSWFADEILQLLRQHGAALVLHDRVEGQPLLLTAPWTYLRFHGLDYGGCYGAAALQPWGGRVRRWLADGVDVYAYFNNDLGGHAPRDALLLRRLAQDGG